MTVPPFSLPEPIDLGDRFRGDTVPLPIWTARDPYDEILDLTGATIWFTAKTKSSLPDAGPGTFQQSTTAGGVEIGLVASQRDRRASAQVSHRRVLSGFV